MLKYELHYSIEILFLQPLPVEVISEQRIFSVRRTARPPVALTYCCKHSACVIYVLTLLSLFDRGTCWRRTLMRRKTSSCELLQGYSLCVMLHHLSGVISSNNDKMLTNKISISTLNIKYESDIRYTNIRLNLKSTNK